MDTNTSCIEFDGCNFTARKDIQISLSDNGKLLNISLCLKNVCPCKDLIVGVLVCCNNKPYALETKKVNVADFCKCCCCCCDCCCCHLEDICIEEFEFIFPPDMCKQEITVRAIAHYIV